MKKSTSTHRTLTKLKKTLSLSCWQKKRNNWSKLLDLWIRNKMRQELLLGGQNGCFLKFKLKEP
jgi:hypothetical protein